MNKIKIIKPFHKLNNSSPNNILLQPKVIFPAPQQKNQPNWLLAPSFLWQWFMINSFETWIDDVELIYLVTSYLNGVYFSIPTQEKRFFLENLQLSAYFDILLVLKMYQGLWIPVGTNFCAIKDYRYRYM